MLVRGPRRRDEEAVAAGAVARAVRKILRNCGWALALGRGRPRGNRCAALVLPLPIALALVAAALLAVVGGAVALGGPPAPPVAGGPLAGRGAVTGLGARRVEPAFTALEQAATAAVRVGAGARESLTGRRAVGILQQAHGR